MSCLKDVIKEAQEHIVTCLENEINKEEQSSYFNAVWFCPEIGGFLYADYPILHSVIFPLIENKTLVYKGLERHRGKLMPKYILNEE